MRVNVFICAEGYLLVPERCRTAPEDACFRCTSAVIGTVHVERLPSALAQRVVEEIDTKRFAFVDVHDGAVAALPALVVP
jgi:hypothetical protein